MRTAPRVWLGMNWITQKKRLAIYLRDGMACAWCGKGVQDSVIFTLDHLKTHTTGGGNHESNLVTCCKFCNDSRGKRTQVSFAKAVAGYLNHSVKSDDILTHTKNTSRRSLKAFLVQAADLIERRGSVAKVLAQQGYRK